MAKRLFWETLDHLHALSPGFGRGLQRKYGHRFKRLVHLVDSTTIGLVANCIDWGPGTVGARRPSSGHVRLDSDCLLPRFVVVKSADEGDDGAEMLASCPGERPGEITVFDKAYVVFAHLFALHQRDVIWVTRAKQGMR